jgi:hypothetical protein
MFIYFKLAELLMLDWAQRTYAYLRGNFTRLEVPDPALTLKVPIEAFAAALAKARDPDTGKVSTLLKNEAKETMIDALRTYANRYLIHNPNVTDADRLELGLYIDKTTGTSEKPLDTAPVITVNTATAMEVWFYYMAAGAKKPAKPSNAYAFVLRYGFFADGQEPKDISELTHVETSLDPPKKVKADEKHRGMKLYYSGSWQISKDGHEGPRTPMTYVFVS